MEQKYKVVWTTFASKQLRKIGNPIAKRIAEKVEDYLVLNPHELGKPLSHEQSGLHSYRFGDWRVIYAIKDEEILILVAKVGHRREIYE